MVEATLDIKQWGNNLGVRLPAAVARAAHLHADQRVRISVENDQVEDYARRKGWDMTTAERWLAPVLGY